MGYYVTSARSRPPTPLRANLTQAFASRLRPTCRQTIDEQVGGLNAFFGDMRRDIGRCRKQRVRTAIPTGQLSTGAYWDAKTSVIQLPGGGWDNPSSTDPASIFLPVRVTFDETLIAQPIRSSIWILWFPGKLAANPDASLYFGGPSGETVYYPNIDLANIVPADFEVTQRPWYINAAPDRNPDRQPVWSEPYLDAALNGLVVTTSMPVLRFPRSFPRCDRHGCPAWSHHELVSNISVGETGYAFLIDSNQRLIAMPGAGYTDLGLIARGCTAGRDARHTPNCGHSSRCRSRAPWPHGSR